MSLTVCCLDSCAVHLSFWGWGQPFASPSYILVLQGIKYFISLVSLVYSMSDDIFPTVCLPFLGCFGVIRPKNQLNSHRFSHRPISKLKPTGYSSGVPA